MLTIPLFLSALLVFGLSVPLAAKMVPPNPIYGFRTPRVRKDERVWYPVNRVTGRNGIVLSLILLVTAVLSGMGLVGFWSLVALGLVALGGLISTFVSAAGIVQQVDKSGPLIDYSSSLNKTPSKDAREALLDKLRKN